MGSFARRSVIVASLVLAIVCVTSPAFLAQEKKGGAVKVKGGARKTTISGAVFDSDDDPIRGVVVHILVAGKVGSVGRATTDIKGAFAIALDLSGPFDVTFTKNKYRGCGVSFLAKQTDQCIGKVLYRKGEKMPLSAAHDHLLFLDRMLFQSLTLEPKGRSILFATLSDEGERGNPLGVNAPIEFSSTSDAATMISIRQKDLATSIKKALN